MNTTAFQAAKKIVANPHGYTEDSVLVAQAFLEAERVPDGENAKSYHAVAQRLYSLLDDIDTASDIAKDDDALYRGIVGRTQAKKRVFVISCGGYTVRLVDDSMLAAAPRRCHLCDYQHGHKIGCVNNPVDIALRAAAPQPKNEGK